ncbi:MAG: hypothetical protein ACRDXX_06300, partial [Stackebrandtia sp.]
GALEALRVADAVAGPGDVIAVSGSLYFVAEARAALGLAAPQAVAEAAPGAYAAGFQRQIREVL